VAGPARLGAILLEQHQLHAARGVVAQGGHGRVDPRATRVHEDHRHTVVLQVSELRCLVGRESSARFARARDSPDAKQKKELARATPFNV